MMYRSTVYIDAVIRVGERDCLVRRYRHKRLFSDLKSARRFISEFPDPGQTTNEGTEYGCIFRIGGHDLTVVDNDPEVIE